MRQFNFVPTHLIAVTSWTRLSSLTTLNNMTSIAALDDKTVWVAAWDGAIYQTTDGRYLENAEDGDHRWLKRHYRDQRKFRTGSR